MVARFALGPNMMEDALAYLPRKSVVDYRRGQTIFEQQDAATGLHLVVRGRIKCLVRLENGSEVVLALVRPDQFFGERGLLQPQRRGLTAIALENSSVMSWTTAEIEEQIERQPRLGIALLQLLAASCADFEQRLQTMALEKTPERVAWSMLHLAERIGQSQPDGTANLPAMTHQLLSEYVGTSREIITFQMAKLRDAGLLTYNRKAIVVRLDAIREHLRQRATGNGGLPIAS